MGLQLSQLVVTEWTVETASDLTAKKLSNLSARTRRDNLDDTPPLFATCAGAPTVAVASKERDRAFSVSASSPSFRVGYVNGGLCLAQEVTIEIPCGTGVDCREQ